MPVTKKLLLRYRVIHTCLSSRAKPYWTLEELVEKLREHDLIVDKRTLENDFHAMRFDERLGYRAPIVYCAKEKGYHYTDPNFVLESFPLSDEDLDALHHSARLLHRYHGSGIFRQFDGVLKKVSRFLKRELPLALVHEESPVYCADLPHFDTLYTAICEKTPLWITGNTFYRKPMILHPYFLKRVDNAWYVAGCLEHTHALVAIGLDRIATLKRAPVSFRPNSLLDRENYFVHTYGAQPGLGPVEHIELWFDRNCSFFFTGKKLHHTQRISGETDDGVLVSLNVVVTDELVETLFVYGDSVDIRKPEWLRKKWVKTR